MIIDPNPEILWAFLGVLALITLNALISMLRAYIEDEFNWDKMADYLRKHILPDGGVLFLMGAVSVIHPEIKALFFVAAATATAKYLAKIRNKLGKQELLEEDEDRQV